MDRKDIIYLGLPYMHDDEVVMDFRADISDIVAADLANRGFNVFAPISAWHHISKKYGLPGEWEYWKDFDESFIKICSKVLIIILEGWRQSVGVTAEIDLSKKYNLEVGYIDPTPYVKELKKNPKIHKLGRDYNYRSIIYDVYGRADKIGTKKKQYEFTTEECTSSTAGI
jgi:hypothetical protein